MTKTVRLRLVSGVIALMVGAVSVWGQGNPTSGGPLDPLLLEDLAPSYRILTDHDVMDGLGIRTATGSRAIARPGWSDPRI
jgi:hypothetical protein